MKRQTLLLWGGTAVSLIFMFLLFRKIDTQQLLAALHRLDWRFLLAAIGLTFVSYWLRAVRWRCLLLHERTVSIGSLYPAIIIGYMANNIFPARLGEFIRTWILAQREQMRGTTVFASLVIDRLIDGMTVMLMLVLVLLNLQLPPGMEQAAVMLRAGGVTTLVIYIAVVAFLCLLKIRPMQAINLLAKLLRPFPVAFSERVIPLVGSFLDGLQFSTRPTNLFMICISSVLIWITATVPIDLVLRGLDIHLPLVASFFIMVLLVFAVMVPAAPGYIGVYHAACYTGLKAFNVEDTQAISIALIIHAIGFFPVILAGMYHLWSGGISLKRIREQAAQPDGADA